MSQLPFDSPPQASEAERVLKLTVAYDGTDFRGFAAQREQRTVEGELTDVLSRVVGAPVKLSCAGRTDSGVHAWGQVVSCPVPADTDPGVAQRAVNGQLGPEVVVREAELLDAGFDARRSAQWRAYTYTIVNRDVADPFRTRTAWWISTPLDISLLRLAADPFLGEHDFAAFCRAGPEGSTTRRRVFESRWLDDGDGVLRYEIVASAFCWRMVRSIVGTLVDVGMERITPGDVLRILRARDRAGAGTVAPAKGLCLSGVGY